MLVGNTFLTYWAVWWISNAESRWLISWYDNMNSRTSVVEPVILPWWLVIHGSWKSVIDCCVGVYGWRSGLFSAEMCLNVLFDVRNDKRVVVRYSFLCLREYCLLYLGSYIGWETFLFVSVCFKDHLRWVNGFCWIDCSFY